LADKETETGAVTRRTSLKYAGTAAVGALIGAVGGYALGTTAPSAPGGATKTVTRESTVTKEVQPGGRTKITVWSWPGMVLAWQKLKQPFEEKFPNIEVEVVNLGVWDLHDKWKTAVVAGTGAPDMTELLGRIFDDQVKLGGLVDLTAKAKKWERLYITSSEAPLYRPDGKIWGIPDTWCPSAVFYRTDIFQKYGIDASKIVTWDDYIDAGKKLPNGPPYMTPIYTQTGLWGSSAFIQFLISRGGNIFDKNGKTIRNNTLAKDTLRWLYDLQAKHKIASAEAWFTAAFNANLKDGKYATWPVGQWGMMTLLPFDQPGKWDIMPWPLWSKDAPRYGGYWGGGYLCISEQSKNKDAAWNWIDYLVTASEAAEAYWAANRSPPLYIPQMANPKFRDPDPYFGNKDILQAYEQRTYPVFVYPAQWTWGSEELGKAIDATFSGTKTPEQAWTDFEGACANRIG